MFPFSTCPFHHPAWYLYQNAIWVCLLSAISEGHTMFTWCCWLQVDLPSWVNFPDYERVGWVNSIISEALSSFSRPSLLWLDTHVLNLPIFSMPCCDAACLASVADSRSNYQTHVVQGSLRALAHVPYLHKATVCRSAVATCLHGSNRPRRGPAQSPAGHEQAQVDQWHPLAQFQPRGWAS